MVGFFMGILNIFFNSEIECVKAVQTKKRCTYEFKIENKIFRLSGCKDSSVYYRLNHMPNERGPTLKDAFRENLLKLDKNRISFRKKSIITVESTGFHIISNKNILMDRIPHISYEYFKKVIRKESKGEMLIILKNLLQTMGWGIVNIRYDKNITIEIRNPPYGLQRERDSWKFLILTILGYLRVLNPNASIKSIRTSKAGIVVLFSKS